VEGVPSLLRAYRLLLAVRPVDAAILVALLASLIGTATAAEAVAIALLAWFSYAMWPRYAAGTNSKAPGSESQVIPALLGRSSLATFLWFVIAAGDDYGSWTLVALGAGLAYVLSWALLAVTAVIRGRCLRPPWLHVHAAVLPSAATKPTRASLADTTRWLLGLGAIVGLGYLAFTWLPDTGDAIVALSVGVLAGLWSMWLIVQVARTIANDWWLWLRWRWMPGGELTAMELLRTLGARRTADGVVRFVTIVRKEHLLRADGESEEVVADLQRLAGEWSGALPPLSSELARQWARGVAHEKLFMIREAGVRLRDELGPLRDDIRERIEDEALTRV
jgi:hypothetical protein